jgi:hypothetical protein
MGLTLLVGGNAHRISLAAFPPVNERHLDWSRFRIARRSAVSMHVAGLTKEEMW